MQPHRIKYWLNANPEDGLVFEQTVTTLCDLYRAAPTLTKQGEQIMSTDEMTGIQALERKYPPLPMKAGYVARVEFEYIRYGTPTLMANWDIATGQIVAPSIGPTRTEDDFAAHIAQTVATDPEARWTFVTDNLNTHQSEALVKFVAQHCHLPDDLGVKEKHGILLSMASRSPFLADPTHAIRFVYTPKHSSWLNQIEIWFTILVRRVLKRSRFLSAADLCQQLLVSSPFSIKPPNRSSGPMPVAHFRLNRLPIFSKLH